MHIVVECHLQTNRYSLIQANNTGLFKRNKSFHTDNIVFLYPEVFGYRKHFTPPILSHTFLHVMKENNSSLFLGGSKRNEAPFRRQSSPFRTRLVFFGFLKCTWALQLSCWSDFGFYEN